MLLRLDGQNVGWEVDSDSLVVVVVPRTRADNILQSMETDYGVQLTLVQTFHEPRATHEIFNLATTL